MQFLSSLEFNNKWVLLAASHSLRNSCQGATSSFVPKCEGIIWEQNVTSARESTAHLSQCNHHNLTPPCLSLRATICTCESSSSWWKSIIIIIPFLRLSKSPQSSLLSYLQYHLCYLLTLLPERRPILSQPMTGDTKFRVLIMMLQNCKLLNLSEAETSTIPS